MERKQCIKVPGAQSGQPQKVNLNILIKVDKKQKSKPRGGAPSQAPSAPCYQRLPCGCFVAYDDPSYRLPPGCGDFQGVGKEAYLPIQDAKPSQASEQVAKATATNTMSCQTVASTISKPKDTRGKGKSSDGRKSFERAVQTVDEGLSMDVAGGIAATTSTMEYGQMECPEKEPPPCKSSKSVVGGKMKESKGSQAKLTKNEVRSGKTGGGGVAPSPRRKPDNQHVTTVYPVMMLMNNPKPQGTACGESLTDMTIATQRYDKTEQGTRRNSQDDKTRNEERAVVDPRRFQEGSMGKPVAKVINEAGKSYVEEIREETESKGKNQVGQSQPQERKASMEQPRQQRKFSEESSAPKRNSDSDRSGTSECDTEYEECTEEEEQLQREGMIGAQGQERKGSTGASGQERKDSTGASGQERKGTAGTSAPNRPSDSSDRSDCDICDDEETQQQVPQERKLSTGQPTPKRLSESAKSEKSEGAKRPSDSGKSDSSKKPYTTEVDNILYVKVTAPTQDYVSCEYGESVGSIVSGAEEAYSDNIQKAEENTRRSLNDPSAYNTNCPPPPRTSLPEAVEEIYSSTSRKSSLEPTQARFRSFVENGGDDERLLRFSIDSEEGMLASYPQEGVLPSEDQEGGSLQKKPRCKKFSYSPTCYCTCDCGETAIECNGEPYVPYLEDDPCLPQDEEYYPDPVMDYQNYQDYSRANPGLIGWGWDAWERFVSLMNGEPHPDPCRRGCVHPYEDEPLPMIGDLSEGPGGQRLGLIIQEHPFSQDTMIILVAVPLLLLGLFASYRGGC